jgi:hypothetical protein
VSAAFISIAYQARLALKPECLHNPTDHRDNGTRTFLTRSSGRRSAVNHPAGDILTRSFETVLMAVLLDDRGTLCHCEQLATG